MYIEQADTPAAILSQAGEFVDVLDWFFDDLGELATGPLLGDYVDGLALAEDMIGDLAIASLPPLPADSVALFERLTCDQAFMPAAAVPMDEPERHGCQTVIIIERGGWVEQRSSIAGTFQLQFGPDTDGGLIVTKPRPCDPCYIPE